MAHNSNISLASLNVRGINDFSKRRAIFRWVRKHKYHIVLLQETFSDKMQENQWQREFGGNILFAHGSKHSKGVMILLEKNFEHTIQYQKIDYLGRFIILKMMIEEEQYIIINVYLPNKETEQVQFIMDLEKVLRNANIESSDKIIIGGDWNIVQNINLDKSGGNTEIKENSLKKLKDITLKFDLQNIFGE